MNITFNTPVPLAISSKLKSVINCDRADNNNKLNYDEFKKASSQTRSSLLLTDKISFKANPSKIKKIQYNSHTNIPGELPNYLPEQADLFRELRNPKTSEARKAQITDILWQTNLRLIESVVTNFNDFRGVQKEDSFSIGSIALKKAIKKYDPDKVNKSGHTAEFSTYAHRCIVNGINMELRKVRNYNRKVTYSLDEQKSTHAPKISLQNNATNRSNTTENIVFRKIEIEDAKKLVTKIDEYVKTLSEKYQTIYELRFKKELPYDEISELTGINGVEVRNTKKNLVRKIRKFFPNYSSIDKS